MKDIQNYFATKGLVDIIYQLDVKTQEKIKQYLLENYSHESYPKKINYR